MKEFKHNGKPMPHKNWTIEEKIFDENLIELGFTKPHYFYEKGNIQVNYSMNGKWNVWEKGTYNLFGQVTTIEQLKKIIDEKRQNNTVPRLERSI